VGVNYFTGRDLSGNVSVLLNSYYCVFVFGIPLYRLVYPYIGLYGKILWSNEKSSQESANFSGYGGDGTVGLWAILYESVGAFFEYQMGWSKLNDKNGTNMGGSQFNIGPIYKL
jgi:hypothetical protein